MAFRTDVNLPAERFELNARKWNAARVFLW